jgi:hypothetical protein
MKVEEKIKKSPIIILLFTVSLLGVLIGLTLSYEDYWSSYLGYVAFPTRKAHEAVYYAAAAVPQVVQILLAYTYAKGTRNFTTLSIFMFAHIADVGTDIYFKAYGQTDPGIWILAFLESEFLFTLGSEVLLGTAFAITVNIFPDFVKQMGEVFDKITTASFDGGNGSNGGGHGGGGNNNNNNQQHRPESRPNNDPRQHQQGQRHEPNYHPMNSNRGGPGPMPQMPQRNSPPDGFNAIPGAMPQSNIPQKFGNGGPSQHRPQRG